MATTDQIETEAAPAGADETDGQQEPPVVWLIRAGAGGEVSDYNFKHGVARMSYSGYGVPDLRSLSSLDDLVEAMRSASSDTPDGRRKPKTIAEQARQLWMFGTEVRVDHLVVMPRMTDQIAVGIVEREYWYDADGTDPDWPHCVSVKWRDKQVLRTDLKDDLLSSINAPGTIHPIRCDDAPWRLQQVMETGRDPGARAGDATDPENGADLILEASERRARDKSKDHLYGRVYRSALDRLAALGREHATLSVYIAHLSLMAQDGWHRQANWVVADLARVPRTEVSRHNSWLEDAGMIAVERSPGQRSRVVLADADLPDADLPALIEQFRSETRYPTDAHKEQERLRAEWAEKLALENIESLSREDLTAFTNSAVNNGEYVRRVGGVMHWIPDSGEPEFDNLLDNIRYLCWGEDELSVRFDQLYLGDSPRKVKGYAGVNISRTLAICHPGSFLPVHRNVGNWGRAKMLSRLGLPAPVGNTPGQRVVDANNRLHEHLEPHFGDDTLAMGTFLGWLLVTALPDKKRSDGPMDLTELADELLIDVDFLEDIVDLLQDKGQIILYGPPGTGKTYLARKLAKELAPDDSCRLLVQFHPSTSYEDFFEGYRPAGTGDDGGIRFELTKGPLARMAERAEASDQHHVMIIDEINRGNLPAVLGELLFLLEYRDEIVQTLYRSEEEPFSLPDNLWFIGTMNTADRSIALVDAALRRRFHFVPFFPDRRPMAGLLARWLERKEEPTWVGDLVDKVNTELADVLEGSHLLLGPSHFMKEYSSSPEEQRERLRRIWEYNIEPFIEDQFFGDPDRIAHFRFDAVMRRNGPAAGSDVDASNDGDDPESTDGSESEHAAAEGDPDAEADSTPEDDR